ncbi:winged helix-turn-helix transcriptional regulator [Streptomyces sp. NPDC050564]|uniref:winged helix-turn-helix transcriptional regulator n=1 Tax=Streptomyces sp. NPDC050564 TaxID=3365631 RepID=UPI00379A6A7D
MNAAGQKILAELRRGGRLTGTEPAARVRLSGSPCHRRLREPERSDTGPSSRVPTADLAAFQWLYGDRPATLPGVQRPTSTPAMKRVVTDRPLPAKGLAGSTAQQAAVHTGGLPPA